MVCSRPRRPSNTQTYRKAQNHSAAKGQIAAATKPAAKPKAKSEKGFKPAGEILLKAGRRCGRPEAISGVGPKLESALNEAGIFHFLADCRLTAEQIEALDGKLDFRGRIARDNWIEQARELSETVS